ncbi:MAG: hypothetical protein IJ325_01370 [Clostridia bacterium]|nr:hypothetical protein [Clostridia bacterium]
MKYAFLRFPGFGDKSVTLTYDDGAASDRQLIEIMSKYGLKDTFNAGMMPQTRNGHRLSTEKFDIPTDWLPMPITVAIVIPG